MRLSLKTEQKLVPSQADFMEQARRFSLLLFYLNVKAR
jgi:hypothetical protein